MCSSINTAMPALTANALTIKASRTKLGEGVRTSPDDIDLKVGCEQVDNIANIACDCGTSQFTCTKTVPVEYTYRVSQECGQQSSRGDCTSYWGTLNQAQVKFSATLTKTSVCSFDFTNNKCKQVCHDFPSSLAHFVCLQWTV